MARNAVKSASGTPLGDDVGDCAFPALISLLDALALPSSMWGLNRASKFISRLVGRRNPWTAYYLNACLNGRLAPGAPLVAAVDNALEHLSENDYDVVTGIWKISVVRSPPGFPVLANALVSGDVRSCRSPGCSYRFVPNHARRRFCFVCSPPRR